MASSLPGSSAAKTAGGVQLPDLAGFDAAATAAVVTVAEDVVGVAAAVGREMG